MPNKKPTLEELLALKKCERPTEAQWAQFDKQLKAKMMRKLVEKPRGFAFSLPMKTFGALGATVALAAFFTFQNFSATGAGLATDSTEAAIASAISKTPLPSVGYSFASHEMPTGADGETPVIAPIRASADSSVRYVSHTITDSNPIF